MGHRIELTDEQAAALSDFMLRHIAIEDGMVRDAERRYADARERVLREEVNGAASARATRNAEHARVVLAKKVERLDEAVAVLNSLGF